MLTALATKGPPQAAAIVAPVRQEIRPAAAGLVRSHVKDDEIFAEGDQATFFYKVVSGVVRTSKLLSDGRRQIDAFHLAGDIFGIETGDEYRFCAEAVGDCVVIAYRRSSIEAPAGGDLQLSQQVAAGMMRSLVRAQNHLLLLGRKNALEKMATFLLDMTERLSDGNAVGLPMSRVDIADHLGLTVETVSRSLTQLERQAIIELPSTRRIVLCDKSALRRLTA